MYYQYCRRKPVLADCQPADVEKIIDVLGPITLKLMALAAEHLIMSEFHPEGYGILHESISRLINDPEPEQSIDTIKSSLDVYLKNRMADIYRIAWEGMDTIPPTGYKTIVAGEDILVLLPQGTTSFNIQTYVSNLLKDQGLPTLALNDWSENMAEILLPDVGQPMSTWLPIDKKFVTNDEKFIMILDMAYMASKTDYSKTDVDSLVVWQYVAFEKV